MLNGSGTLDALAALDVLGDATLGCAAHVTKTITPEPRPGNPPPRIAEVPAGLVNSIGLPGPGVDGVPARRCCRPSGRARGRAADRLGRRLRRGRLRARGWRSWTARRRSRRSSSTSRARTSRAAARRSASTPARPRPWCPPAGRGRTKPLLVKLAPTTSLLADVARAAEAAGAGALVVGNTVPGTVVARGRGGSLLGGGGGGLSGPAIRPVTLRAVLECRAAVAVDLVGLGGVETAQRRPRPARRGRLRGRRRHRDLPRSAHAGPGARRPRGPRRGAGGRPLASAPGPGGAGARVPEGA